jgi:acyl-CoA-binding protein
MTIDDFGAAVAAVQDLETDPGNEVKLRLYALYKQATEGDVAGSRPGILNQVGRAKWDAWAGVTGMSGADAEAAYVDQVNALLE